MFFGDTVDVYTTNYNNESYNIIARFWVREKDVCSHRWTWSYVLIYIKKVNEDFVIGTYILCFEKLRVCDKNMLSILIHYIKLLKLKKSNTLISLYDF